MEKVNMYAPRDSFITLKDHKILSCIIYRDDVLGRVDFLDISLDLEKAIFKPYRKPGDRPRYVHSQSNHPPQVIKNIPAGLRLSQNSCNEEVFLEAIPDYQEELNK
jgi:hypothetical protein